MTMWGAFAFAQPTIISQNWIDPMCNGGSNGSITVMAMGVAPITYSIDGGSTWVPDGVFIGLSAGNYTVIAQDGLSATTSVSFTLGEPLMIDISVDQVIDETCLGMDGAVDITVSNAVSPAVNSWTGPGSFTSSSEDISGLSAGNYFITVTDDNGCSRTVSVPVNLVNTVTAGFTPDVTTGSSPLNVNFSNSSTGATSYTWDFGDGNGSTSASPSNTYLTQGSYTVMMVAEEGACSDTAWSTINVIGPSFLIPNVFTPNNDGINDLFQVVGTDLASVDAVIYNRFGEIVYTWTGIRGGWDGHTAPAGLEVPSGTYFYHVQATDLSGVTYNESGAVELMR